MKISYYRELDGVRAIAALMVMFFHFFESITGSGTLLTLVKKISVFGQTGVSLFFVLSGFLITRILFVTKGSPNYFSSFYLRRLLRIFPLYYLFLFLFFVILPLVNLTGFVPWSLQYYYWFYLQGFPMTFHWNQSGPDHFWSLAVEEHFYLFWPLIIYYFSSKKLLYVIGFLVLSALITRVFFIKNGYEVFYFTFTRLDELAFGALIAVFELHQKLLSKNFSKFFLLFILVFIPTIVLWVWNNSSGNALMQIIKFNLISLIYFSVLCLVLVSNENHFIKKALRTSGLNFLGRISYGLYVYHPLSFLLFEKFFHTEYILVNFSGSFILTVLMASLSYYGIEKRFLQLKKYFEYQKKPEPVLIRTV